MSEHKRKQIRDQVIDTIKAALPELSGRVFGRRMYDLESDELPGVLVYSSDEDAQPHTPGLLRSVRRELNLSAVLVVNPLGTDEDALDALAWAIEQALEADRGQGGLALDTNYTGCSGFLDAESDPPVAGLELEFAIAYLT